MKRYYDLSEGVPKEAISIMEVYNSQIKDQEGSPFILGVTDVYTRGKELIIVEEMFETTLEAVFNA